VKLYAAVSGRSDAVVEAAYPHVLVSYALDPDLALLRAHTPRSLLVDSGAFTAWTKGHAIDVDDFGQWALTLRARAGLGYEAVGDVRFINLDVIPGERGRKPTADEVEHAAGASMANADRLRAMGVDVIEVYHYGEPEPVLDALLERRQPGGVVAIGGSVGVEHRERIRWHDAVWAHVFAEHARRRALTPEAAIADGGIGPTTTARGRLTEVPPLHGLGTSNEDLARRYPWWSVDSSTHAIPFRFGRTLNGRGRQEFIESSGGTVLRRAVPAQRLEAVRILRRWQRLERDMTAAWERRGVRYAT
jgi:hypothetical protein